MKGETWQRNTDGLAAHAKQRTEQKQQQVDQAIIKLVRENKPVNFNTVAITAGVTKAYLYNHPMLRDRIETLRASQVRKTEPQPIPSQRTERSQEVLLAAKDRRIKELEQENQRLKDELKMALGKLYERI